MLNNYYNKNAISFFNETVNADLSALYQHFLPLLRAGAHILDAGCGSGRDTHFFIQQGFQVTAFDASESLVTKATEYTGINVSLNTFDNFQKESLKPNEFDAVWACASLLHVPSVQMFDTFVNLSNQLKADGLFYCSFKYGSSDIERNGRYFTNADEQRLSIFIKKTNLVIDKTWITADVRPDRQDEKWFNAILKKVL